MVGPLTQLRAVVIDDDSNTRMLIRRSLEMRGFAVRESATGAEGLLQIKEYHPDVVTLDLDLPDLDGVEVCRRLRKFSEAYVFIITGRADEIDEIIGLEAGADDYISKPFSRRVVQARVAAALRRHRPTPQRPTPQRRASDVVPMTEEEVAAARNGHQRRATDAAPATRQRRATDAAPATVLRHGPLAVEVEGRTASLAGVELELTRTEFDLLAALTGAPRLVWTREALLRKVWGNEWASDEHLVEVHIGNLRKKLGDKGREPRFIRTVRGVGYRMAPAEAAA
ncbi:response regulator transcription factor [Arthrobacter sp. PAMC25564]|uniref:response regulator transcription factor n=1 Tax=Arthrobacter sp. PAMC25564 TaxID=2565366 RepID=UPI0010A254B3|nr:response regulator transcription factor [Arthrobacter sp. PAMC25564]QCB96584.1 response regulator transcription factor [Arthrobacter sp. PAMC25564]